MKFVVRFPVNLIAYIDVIVNTHSALIKCIIFHFFEQFPLIIHVCVYNIKTENSWLIVDFHIYRWFILSSCKVWIWSWSDLPRFCAVFLTKQSIIGVPE